MAIVKRIMTVPLKNQNLLSGKKKGTTPTTEIIEPVILETLN
jgi:hypothetical protein